MQFTIVSVLALAGSALATPWMNTAPVSTDVVMQTMTSTIYDCAATVVNCPGRTTVIVSPMTYGAAYPTGAPAGGNGAGAGAGAAQGTGYAKPTLTGYTGPAYTGAAGQVKAAGALAGVGAFAALLL